MTETPRMVIVPAEPDCETVRTLRQWRDVGWKLGAPTERDIYSGIVAASPNAGKISRADLENAAARSYCECINRYKAWENLPVHTQDNWRTSIAAAIRALGLEIAEEGDSTDATD